MFLLLLFCVGYASSQTFSSVGSMATPLAYQTATLLQNGTVLIAGGDNNAGITPTAEIYNPSTNTFSPTGTMSVARYSSTATLLTDGTVMIAGGSGGKTAELYDPKAGTFSVTTGSMTSVRYNATATLLQDGTVLIAGGDVGDWQGLTSAEIYNPATKTFTATAGSMSKRRTCHTATLLPDGTVLIAGGQGNYSGQTAWNTAEIYNPTSQTFTVVGNMTTARYYHTATLLTDGTVLLAGGHNNQSQTVVSSAEIYTPSAKSFAATGSMNSAREVHTATSLNDGTVLIVGGDNYSSILNSAEVYSPSLKTFALTGSTSTSLEYHTATLLSSGSVLIAGGFDQVAPWVFLSSAELYSYPFTSGTLNPKYVVLGVIYSPPGAKSTVSYGNSTMVGTSSSLSSSFTKNETVSASIDLVGGILGTGGTNTYTASSSFTQEADTSSSYAVNQTTSTNDVFPGPVSSSIGVDHDYDKVLVWLNPALKLTIPGTSGLLVWNGYSYDSSDTYSPNDMDVVRLPVSCLKNYYSTLNGCNEADLQKRIQRGWDTSGTGGLTPADYAQILQSDPFATNPAYDPSVPASDGSMRFDLQSGEAVPFQPALNGDQPETNTYSFSIQKTTTAGQGAKDTKQVGASVKSSGGVTGTFIADFDVSVSFSGSLQWQNQWSTTQTNTSSSTVGFSITEPAYTDYYQGPTSFQVYKDNVYGTLMLYTPGFDANNPGIINVNPNPLNFASTVPVGSVSAPLTVTLTNSKDSNTLAASSMLMATPVAAFSDPSYSIVSGTDTCSGQTIPLNSTCHFNVQFSPVASEVGSTGTTTISGTMYLTGLAGTAQTVVEAEAPVSGLASMLPQFSVTATPNGSTALSLGHSTRYSINVSPLNGFTGPVGLTVSGLPAGVTYNLSPSSITTSGTATLTLTSAYSPSTFIGTSTITVTGTSGSLTNAASFTLTTRPLQYKGYCGVQ
jgi:hypothetical protein